MSIGFNCESCKKKIKAPNEAGGKWGNCPFCKHRCYIPSPKTGDEVELTLTPLDAGEETQMEELMRESKNLTHNILSQSALPENEPESKSGNHTAQEKEVIKKCILYLRQVADGELAASKDTFSQLRKSKKQSIRILSSMARAERPEPELADLSDGVLQGLIRDVCTKLS